MGDCEIPINISKRKEDIHMFEELLKSINDQFEDLKKIGAEGEEDTETETQLRKYINEIDKKLYAFDLERQDFNKF